jgi:uncharacterized membrane protein YhaH (DUF805 family)
MAAACIKCGRPLSNRSAPPPPLPGGESRFAAESGGRASLTRRQSSMSFGEALSTCFSKYATFSGRARRAEYWWFMLFNSLGSVVARVVDEKMNPWLPSDELGVVGSLWMLALLLPVLSVGWRRLHDTGRSGWWIGGFALAVPGAVFVALASVEGGDPTGSSAVGALLGLLLLAWSIVLLVFVCSDGTPGPNAFGPDPKGRMGRRSRQASNDSQSAR